MVSTTLTTIATGQPTSSANHHHLHQSSAATTANNSNYQRSTAQQQQQHHSSLSATTTTTARSNCYYNSLALNGIGNTNDTQSKTANIIQTVLGAAETNRNTQHYTRPSLQFNGKGEATAIAAASPETPTTDSVQSEQTAKLQRNEAAKPTVNLTQALLSGSPPLNDQISLLFPKCRPKHASANNNSHSSNGGESADANLNPQLRDARNTNGTPANCLPESDSHNTPTAASPTPIVVASSKTTPTNFYKTVNIITQSPPPPSTSSVSSESLSSVTPRISTNPFLCSNLTNGDGVYAEAHKLSEADEDHGQFNDEEELPLSATYPASFYYHTTREDEKLLQCDEKRGYEMPRKRTNYNSNFHHGHSQSSQQYGQVPGALNHHAQHQQQQQQQLSLQLHNGNGSQNPFIKDNYWETRHNITPASTVLNSPDYSGNEMELPPASSRRAYHQQSYTNSSSSGSYMPTRQQHHIRVGRSPVNHSEQQQSEQQLPSQNPCADGLTPLASHYLYGSKSSLEQLHHQHVGNDWDKRDRVERERERERGRERERERDRDREQREQRKVYADREREHEREREQEWDRERERELRTREQHMRDMHDIDVAEHQHSRQQKSQARLSNSDRHLSVLTNGEVVVFDDMAESWQNLRVTTGPSATRAAQTTASAAAAAAAVVVAAATSSQQAPSSATTATVAASGASQASLTLADIKDEKLAYNNCESNSATMYKDHKRYYDRNYSITVESRHGIIEYEGSPRRIGQSGHIQQDEILPANNAAHTQNAKTSQFASTPVNVSSPQQQYPARPGFPQRIISPPREKTPPIMLMNYGSNAKQHQYQLQQQQSQPSPTDNNAEDTSNDVSEIGTISDLTTPEAISTAALPLAATATDSNTATDNVPLPTSSTNATGTTSATATTVTMATPSGTSALSIPTKSSTFDYLYEFSETRKVLEEFFKCPSNDEKPIENGSDVDSIDIQYEFHSNLDHADADYEDDDADADVDAEVDDDDAADADNSDIPQLLQQTQQTQHQQQNGSQQQQQPPPILYTHSSLSQYQQQNHSGYNANSHNHRRHFTGSPLMRDFDFFLDSASRSSGEQIDQQDGINHNQMDGRHHYRYSPETTDYDSNCGDLDSLSGEINGISTSCSNYAKYYASSMPVLEDGLSSGHTSDTENNNHNNMINNLPQTVAIHHTPLGGGISMLMDMKRISTNNSLNSMNNITASTTDACIVSEIHKSISPNLVNESFICKNESPINGMLEDGERASHDNRELLGQSPSHNNANCKVFKNIDPELDSLYSISVFHRPDMVQMTPPPPAPAPHRKPNVLNTDAEILQPTPYKDLRFGATSTSPTTVSGTSITTAISSTLQRTKPMHPTNAQPPRASHAQPPPIPERHLRTPSPVLNSPVWMSRHLDSSGSKGLLESASDHITKNLSADEDDVDTDLETDRLLGHQRLDDQGYYDENKSWDRKPRSLLSKISPKQQLPSTKTRNGYNALLSSTPELPPPIPPKNNSTNLAGSMSSSEHSDKSPLKSSDVQDCGVALGSPGGSDASGCISGSLKKDIDLVANSSIGVTMRSSSSGVGDGNSSSVTSNSTSGEKKVKKSKNKEGGAVLIEGVLFRAKYLGSTQLVCEGQPTKSTRMMQAEEAVSRIKAPDGDVQPSTEVDLFISTEKIMVLNTDLKEIMMDHALRTISYIADIGDLVVLMARRRFVPQDIDDAPKPNRTPKMICHVFESDEAQFIAQSIGQAFQVAYMEFLKANGIEDHSFVKEMDYQEVLNSQEIFGDELEIFAKKELQKEVVVPKAKGEILGVVIVESGWGSMLPTVVIANLMSSGAAARCGQLNIGDQLIAINGLSLVGLPLSTCQTYIKNTKNQTVVKFTVVPCAPVVEVKIKRPNTKYQLGFSVQNGVICSLLRGGIAERGGVRVGHRIIEINNQSVVAVPHEKIVNLLATSVGEILMKTMPTSMFRLLTGQENPIYI